MKNNLSYFIIYVVVAALPAFIYYSCSGIQEKNNAFPGSLQDSNGVIQKPGSSFNDTLIVDITSAVFYQPDSLQREKIKAINKKPIFESITHDCFFQMRNARLVLQKYWPRIVIIEASRCRFLLFIKKDKTKIIIDLNSKNDICGIFLFDREKKPELADMMNIDSALGFYFKK